MNDPFTDVPQIDVASVYTQLQRGEVEMVDVREASEWDLGHIEGIKWIPLGQLPARWRELEGAKKLICVCLMGNRSNYAALSLRSVGIDAINMEGGMLQWKASHLPITAPGIVELH